MYFTDNLCIEKYDEDNESSPYHIMDRTNTTICFIKKSEYSEDLIQRLDDVFRAGFCSGVNHKQHEIKKVLGLG